MSKDALIYLIEEDLIKLNSFLKEFDFSISLNDFNIINDNDLQKFHQIIILSLKIIEKDQGQVKNIIQILKILNIDSFSFVLDSLELLMDGMTLFLF